MINIGPASTPISGSLAYVRDNHYLIFENRQSGLDAGSMLKREPMARIAWQKVERSLEKIIAELKENFPAKVLDDLREYIEAGGYTLCPETILLWLDRPVPHFIYDAIETLGVNLQLTPKNLGTP